MDQIGAQYKAILDGLENINSNAGPGTLNPEDFSIQSKNGRASLSLAPTFQQIWSLSENFMTSVYPLLGIVSGHGQLDFSGAVNNIKTSMEQLSEQRGKIHELMRASRDNAKRIEDIHAKSGPLRDEIERLKVEGETARKTLAEYSSEGTQSITAIRGAADQAKKLKEAVDSYSAAFENFQKQLSERDKTFQVGKNKQDELLDSLKNIETEIKRLNGEAEAMLPGATVAGLAGSFDRIHTKITGELNGSRAVFYFSIFLLFLSVVPLLAYVFPALSDWVRLQLDVPPGAPKGESVVEVFGQIAVRALLLLPAAWFAKFAATRHAVLFRLKEHYAYKYSLAASVEGFKRQAEPFKDGIAAATFYELTFNPAERMESKSNEERHPNPVMEWFMKKVGATYDGK
jgi:hypothetical protein